MPIKPGLVAHHLADREVALAVGGELGPVLGDPVVVPDLAGLHQLGDADRGRPLGGGEHQLQRLVGPGLAGCLVGDTAPQVDPLHAVDVQAEPGAQLVVVLEVGGERVGNGAETLVGVPGDVRMASGHRSSLTVAR